MRNEKRFFYLSFMIIIAAGTKSAQIPFSAWLPAAIAAPTPVSALVHSSTLVTAGVYLLIRFYNFIFSNRSLNYILFVGRITSIIARLAALYENDIKKIVALSTLSQLGIIIIRIGLHSYLLRFFHLIAHAFFKALLFIATGNIIHINSDYQDLRTARSNEMGAIRTRKFVLIANFSLMGLPFISRFFRKESIIELIILENNYIWIYIIMLVRVLRTAIYRTRFIIAFYVRSFNKLAIIWMQDENKIINTRILILLIPASLGGWIMREILVSFQIITRNSSIILVLVLLCLFTGVILGYMISGGRNTNNSTIFQYRIVAMWNLIFISNKLFVIKRFRLRSNLTKNIEVGFLIFIQTQWTQNKIVEVKFLHEISSYLLNLIVFSIIWILILNLVYY